MEPRPRRLLLRERGGRAARRLRRAVSSSPSSASSPSDASCSRPSTAISSSRTACRSATGPSPASSARRRSPTTSPRPFRGGEAALRLRAAPRVHPGTVWLGHVQPRSLPDRRGQPGGGHARVPGGSTRSSAFGRATRRAAPHAARAAASHGRIRPSLQRADPARARARAGVLPCRGPTRRRARTPAAGQRRAPRDPLSRRAIRVEPPEGRRELAAQAARLLGLRSLERLPAGERLAWRRWAPVRLLAAGDRAMERGRPGALAAVVRAKGAVRESDFVARFDRHRRLRQAVRQIAERR